MTKIFFRQRSVNVDNAADDDVGEDDDADNYNDYSDTAAAVLLVMQVWHHTAVLEKCIVTVVTER